MTADLAVVTAGRPDVLACWLAAWRKTPNFGRWEVYVGDDGGFPAAFRRALEATPSVHVFDMREDVLESFRVFPELSHHHAAWSTKVSAMARCPARWCLWLDHDCEATGDLSPIVDYALARGKWFAAPFYGSFGTHRYGRTRVTQNGICIVDTHSPNLALWREGFARYHDSNDETVMLHCFGGKEALSESITDLFRPAWYASPDTFPQIRRSLPAAIRAMREATPPALVRHWCAGIGKRVLRELHPA